MMHAQCLSAMRRMAILWAFAMLPAQAQTPQQQVDAGVQFGLDNISGVKDLSKNTDAAQVPGYAGTDLNQSRFYRSQDLTGMQSEAQIQLNSGSANDASRFVYDQANLPKLPITPTDPLMQDADAIAADALANPGMVTVQTGSCDTATVSQPQTRLETCTAWIQPTTQTCNKTLNVDVTWTEQSSCRLGVGFNERRTLHNRQGADDYVYARAYCNPGSGEGFVDLQVNATDGDPRDCTSWTDITVSTQQTTPVYSGALLRPRFRRTCELVPVVVEGSCDTSTPSQCSYTLTYYELQPWHYDDNFGRDVCGSSDSGIKVDLASMGYSGPGSVYNNSLNGGDPLNGLYCAFIVSKVTLNFEKPNITRTPTVTESWNNGCAFLESQVQ